jgi:hypothetical protein
MSRTIEAVIKQTGATPDKKSARATSQTMKAVRIHRYGGPVKAGSKRSIIERIKTEEKR